MAVGEPAEARGEHEHHERHRDARAAGGERGEARDALQEQHQQEEHDAQPAVHRERLDVARREVAAGEQAERQHRVAARAARRARTRRTARRRRSARAPPAGSAKPRIGCSISPNVIPASPSAHRRAPTRSSRVPGSRGASAGTARETMNSVPSTSGRLIRKIQRHDAESTSWPPTTGPSTVPMPPHAVHAPTACAALGLRERPHDHGQRRGREQRARQALQRPREHEQLDRRRERAQQRGDAEAGDAGHEHAPLADHVAERAADQQEAS